MPENFCKAVGRKLRRLGFARKAAARIAKCFSVIMVVTCGLLGLCFVIPRELYEPITGAGMSDADARPGTFFSAVQHLHH